MTFRVGQKVVCVDARTVRGGPLCRLTKGAVYTITGIFHGGQAAPDGRGVIGEPHTAIGFTLDEMPPPQDPISCGAFHAWRFRPVQERKTDISWAHKLVEPKQLERVKERVS